MIQTISNFRVFRDSLLLFACLGGTVSLPYGGNTSATRGGTRRSQPQKLSKSFQSSTTAGAWLHSKTSPYSRFSKQKWNNILKTAIDFINSRCWVLSQGSWGHALPLPSVSSCFQKCLSQKGWMKNKSPCISPVQTCSCKMALHDWVAIPNLAPPAFQTQNHTLRRWFARIVQWLIIYPVKRPQTVWRVGNQCLKLKKQATLCVRPYTRTSYQDIKEKFTSSSKGDLLYRGYLQDLHREDFTRISRRSPHKDLHKIIQCRGLLNEDLDTRIRVQDHVRTT